MQNYAEAVNFYPEHGGKSASAYRKDSVRTAGATNLCTHGVVVSIDSKGLTIFLAGDRGLLLDA